MKTTKTDTNENAIQAYVKSLEEKVQKLERENKNLQEALLLMRKRKFGRSSEKTEYADGYEQLTLFNEAEEESNSKAPEPQIQEVKAYVKKRRRGEEEKRRRGQKEESIKGLDVETVICELTVEERKCPVCENEMRPIGREKVREEVTFIPAKLVVKEYYRMSYSCDACYRESDEAVIEKANVPSPVMKRSLCSPSAAAYIMYQKYVNAVPLYRQEKDFRQIGFELSRATMSNWVIRCAQDWLKPLYEAMRQDLLKEEVILADETRVQVLKEPGKNPSSNSYMWLYRSGPCSDRKVILFEYKISRSGNHARRFLKGYGGYLMTDGYAGYEKVPDITRCMCFAHVRRYFTDAIPKEGSGSPAVKGRDYCNELFRIEKELAECEAEERKEKRLLKSRPVLGAFYNWLDKVNALPGSSLYKAVSYAKNHKEYLSNFLLDGRVPISNNLSENSIRPFVIGRKNHLFSDTPEGAEASALIYSIVETAKEEGLKITEYLTYIFRELPNADFKNEPELLKKYLPWSEDLPQECRI